MSTLYILDVPENKGIAKLAVQDARLTVGRVGPYFEISSDGQIVIDRQSSGCRHAVWYSAIAGVADGRITQHDKNALRVEPT
ncbi:hypothetical protein [Streptomyces malaysiensis]|uniref:hypothetical protein n=1 Tax=Streptomyces malaysiensis TaxID=92644 RepID=UPI00371912AA